MPSRPSNPCFMVEVNTVTTACLAWPPRAPGIRRTHTNTVRGLTRREGWAPWQRRTVSRTGTSPTLTMPEWRMSQLHRHRTPNPNRLYGSHSRERVTPSTDTIAMFHSGHRCAVFAEPSTLGALTATGKKRYGLPAHNVGIKPASSPGFAPENDPTNCPSRLLPSPEI